MGCLKLTERDYYRLHNRTEKTAYSRFSHTVSDDQIGNRTQFSSRKAAKKQSILLAYNDLNQIKTASPAKLGMASMLAGDYQYDVYGNLVSTPKAHYRYNLNNRLVEVNLNPSASSRLCGSLSFSYDGNGRRTDKQVFDKDGKLIRHTKFLYSGFKCVAEIDALSNKVEKFYQWQGGQLLGVYNPKTEKSLSVLTDGNKNVIGLMGSNGDISAQFAYSPFGELLSSQSADVADCSFGFSSEYRDKETGLVYYNFRYLSPELGRWLSRDLVEERGGFNLYLMLENKMTNKIDFLGFGPGTITCTLSTVWPSFDSGWQYVTVAPLGFQGGGSEGGGQSNGFSIFYHRQIVDFYECQCCSPTTMELKTRTRDYVHQQDINHTVGWNAGIPGTWPPLNLWDWLGGIIGGIIAPPTLDTTNPEEVDFVQGSIDSNFPTANFLPPPSDDTGVPTKWCLWI